MPGLSGRSTVTSALSVAVTGAVLAALVVTGPFVVISFGAAPDAVALYFRPDALPALTALANAVHEAERDLTILDQQRRCPVCTEPAVDPITRITPNGEQRVCAACALGSWSEEIQDELEPVALDDVIGF